MSFLFSFFIIIILSHFETPQTNGSNCCSLKVLCANGHLLIDFSLTVKAVTLIFISGRCSASSSAKQEKSGSIYNLVKN